MRRILWFRRDLRIDDQPLLAQEGDVFPLFIFDPHILDKLPKNDRRVTFIFRTLLSLKRSLRDRGLDLAIFFGKPEEVFEWILSNESFDNVCASGDYDPYAKERDIRISHLLEFHFLQDTYLFAPDEVLKSDGTPYLVFTPFYNRVKSIFHPNHMCEYLPLSQHLISFDYNTIHAVIGKTYTPLSIRLESIGFEETPLDAPFLLSPSEKLEQFQSKLDSYEHDRDFFSLDATSHLSIDLRFGRLSIRALLRWLLERKKEGMKSEPYFRQLIFREFYAMLLYHFPHLTTQNFRYPFKGIENNEYFNAFCEARTGVPIIDAGVRELLLNGEMHNRVRMIVASFFTKNLLLPWQWGEAFFAQHLNDYDAASNIFSWQWSAGTGVDPQPYFRIFNPYRQSETYDPEGTYLRHWLPELASLSLKTIYSEEMLGTQRNFNYPKRLVAHKESVEKAKEYFSTALK